MIFLRDCAESARDPDVEDAGLMSAGFLIAANNRPARDPIAVPRALNNYASSISWCADDAGAPVPLLRERRSMPPSRD
jgi:hypothetical protein